MQPILLAAIPEINISEVTRVRDWKVMAECMDHFFIVLWIYEHIFISCP
jgi:hypothetical protein